ncbi:hypothetical protein [Pantanalinema sp. GBBB05]|uniref:hypothetical protein n=1 Tax=Pantanalinema sp. GBBB05 TaxID=2604139 RepID=UPI001DC07A24|nr:hypothetical protein [Pantanalinema sp. GBBB05]
MSQSGGLRQQAKQGNPDAIETLLNQVLLHKQMTTHVSLEDSWLHIALHCALDPDLQTALILIDRELSRLNSPLIHRIRIEADSNQQALEWSQEFDLGTYAQVGNTPAIVRDHSSISPAPHPPDLPHPPHSSPAQTTSLSPLKISNQGLNAVVVGFLLAIVLINVGFLRVIFYGFNVLVHELGHAITHWLFGRPAIPSVNILFGGGVTLTFGQSALVLALIYAGISYLFYRSRHYPRVLGVLTGFTLLYTLCLLTSLNMILSIFMGKGMEAIAIGVCLYLAISGYYCRFAGDRAIYAMLGFYTFFSGLQFSWQLIRDADYRTNYEEGIGGGAIDNDFVILATQYFHVDLAVIATFFLFCCLLAPAIALLLYRYERWWVNGIQQLFAVKQ